MRLADSSLNKAIYKLFNNSLFLHLATDGAETEVVTNATKVSLTVHPEETDQRVSSPRDASLVVVLTLHDYGILVKYWNDVFK